MWIGSLLVSVSLAYERSLPYAAKRSDQGYALPAQGYAIAPASDFGPSAGYGAPQQAPVASSGYGAPVAPAAYGAPSYEADYYEEGMFVHPDVNENRLIIWWHLNN